jgi:DNA-binding PadR family transcriptional regulator
VEDEEHPRERLHGYAIMTAIEQIGGDALRVEEGSIYPALRRMEQASWLRAEWPAAVNRVLKMA